MFLLTMAVALGGCGNRAAAAERPAVSADAETEKNDVGTAKGEDGSETAKEDTAGDQAGRIKKERRRMPARDGRVRTGKMPGMRPAGIPKRRRESRSLRIMK